MDNRIANDMISSGMIPSGKKNKEDLSRTQYGSAPSPSKLMDAYKSMYGNKEEVINEHHKKDADGNTIPHEDEEINEGKIPAGLQAYLDKKKGKKEDKKDMKEQYDLVYEHFIGEGFSEEETFEKMSNLTEEQLDEFMKALATRAAQYGANLGKSPETKVDFIGGIKRKPFEPKRKPFEAERKPFDPKPKPGEQGFKAKSAMDVVNAAAALNRKKPVDDTGKVTNSKGSGNQFRGPENKKNKEQAIKDRMEGVDTYDVMLNHFLNEGYQREDIIKAMSSLSEEPISLAVLGGLLAKGGAMAAKGAAVAGKAAMGAAKAGAGAMKGAMKGVVSAADPVTKTVSKVATKIKKDPMGAIDNVRRVTNTVDSAKNLITPTQRQEKKVAAGQVSSGSNIASSADLFDIVKGQLLDEGLTEEEIKDIMLTLTPDEILSEYKDVPAGQMNYASYGVPKPKSYEMDSLKRQTAPGGGKDYKIEDKKNVVAYNQKKIAKEEYKNFDPKNPDPKQVKKQAEQEKNRQKFNDPMGVKDTNIGGQGVDPMNK